jgi:predicted nucleic acid-binding protein
MDVFFDTSVIVPLLIKEVHTTKAQAAWSKTVRAWAWRWMQVEAEAALGRRRASTEAWAQWRTLANSMQWLEMEPSLWPQLCAFNRPLRLRAADAGHLFVYDRAMTVVPGLRLATFDDEMIEAAEALALPLV